MSFPTLRFMHAANLRLDMPLRVAIRGSLTKEARACLEDATLDAFNNVVDGCIAQKADFLLITGDSFAEAQRSLRARLALMRGFEKLNQQQIQVFVIPGTLDPAEAWRAIPKLPDNVTVCYSSNPEPATVTKNGKSAATISASAWYGDSDAFGIRVLHDDGDHQVFRIGIASQSSFEDHVAAMDVASGVENWLTWEDEPPAAPAVRPQNVEPVAALSSDATANSVDDAARNRSMPGSAAAPTLRLTGQSATPSSGDAVAVEPANATDANEPDIANLIEEIADHETTATERLDAEFLSYVNELMKESGFNYVAMTGTAARHTEDLENGRLHSPGMTQPSEGDAGTGSVSLVQVDSLGRVTIRQQMTQSVVWKKYKVRTSHSETPDNLIRRMQGRLAKQTSEKQHKLWIVNWTINGPVDALCGLRDAEFPELLSLEIPNTRTSGGMVELLHVTGLIPDPQTFDEDDPDRLLQQYAELTEGDRTRRFDGLHQSLIHDEGLSDGWKRRLESLFTTVSRRRIQAGVRFDGDRWFADEIAEENPETAGETKSLEVDSA